MELYGEEVERVAYLFLRKEGFVSLIIIGHYTRHQNIQRKPQYPLARNSVNVYLIKPLPRPQLQHLHSETGRTRCQKNRCIVGNPARGELLWRKGQAVAFRLRLRLKSGQTCRGDKGGNTTSPWTGAAKGAACR